MLEYKTISELVNKANFSRLKISDIVLADQVEQMELSREKVYERMDKSLGIMEASIKAGMNPSLRSTSGLTGGDASKMLFYSISGGICGGLLNR